MTSHSYLFQEDETSKEDWKIKFKPEALFSHSKQLYNSKIICSYNNL
jgi:hypothetical protein